MQTPLSDFSEEKIVKKSIRENWKHYHYCLGRSQSVELSIGRYLTWFLTKMPDPFMNLVVCTELPSEGIDELIENALSHFRSLKIQKLSWLAEEGIPARNIKKSLVAHGLTLQESFAVEMAVDLSALPESIVPPTRLKIIPVEDPKTLSQWIHVASMGFGIPEEFESTWYEFFAEAVLDSPFQCYLALLNGQPVGTSQLFLSSGVAGIYNVTCIPEARRQGIGAALTLAPLLYIRDVEYRIGVLQASELGYTVYRRLGFQDFGRLSVYLWENEAELSAK
jgi:ribosomal protein S18 acetylase RimI-like enzyme